MINKLKHATSVPETSACPALKLKCLKCRSIGHFKMRCESSIVTPNNENQSCNSRIQNISDNGSDTNVNGIQFCLGFDDFWTNCTGNCNESDTLPVLSICLRTHQQQINMLIETGACKNIINRQILDQMQIKSEYSRYHHKCTI